MITENVERLIVKFLSNQASSVELDALAAWLEDEENLAEFKAYVKVNYAVNYNLNQFNVNSIKEILESLIAEQNKVVKLNAYKKYAKYAAAAVVTGLLVAVYFFKDSFNTPNVVEPVIVNTSIHPGTNKAILTLEDGTGVVLEKGGEFVKGNVQSDGEKIVYKDANSNSNKTQYNYLTIPRGGQFFLTLEDGTNVWLNSESKLKYPVAFTDGKTRTVELLYGEAYFEVSPSTKHKGSRFTVTNNNHEIEVLGTKFNVKAYNDEPNTETTLVEGKVSINYQSENYLLLPNQQSSLNRNSNSISFREVDVYQEISWVKGVFSFDNKSLKEIMKVLSRWYDFNVVFKSKSVENELFVGVLGKNEKIEDILSNIKSLGIINSFEFEGKKIIIE